MKDDSDLNFDFNMQPDKPPATSVSQPAPTLSSKITSSDVKPKSEQKQQISSSEKIDFTNFLRRNGNSKVRMKKKLNQLILLYFGLVYIVLLFFGEYFLYLN